MGPTKSDLYIERLIRQAQEEGKFKNLSNEGRPIKLEEENPYLDNEWRAAFKVMENGGYVPPWIELDKEIEGDLERVRRDRQEHLRWLRRRLDDIKYGPTDYFVRDLRRLNASHQYFLKAHAQKLEEINRKIDEFNSACPVVSLLKVKHNTADIVHKYDLECPAIPEL